MYKAWSRWGNDYEYAVKEAAFQFSAHVAPYEYKQAQECLRGLIHLLHYTGNQVGPSDELSNLSTYNPSLTVEDVLNAFRKQVNEALEGQRIDFEDDKEWFISRYRCETLEDAEHPLGDEEFAVMEAWLSLNPFEWFMFSHSVKEAGIDALEENLDFFMLNEPERTTSYVHESINKATVMLMERFAKRVEENPCKTEPEQRSIAS